MSLIEARDLRSAGEVMENARRVEAFRRSFDKRPVVIRPTFRIPLPAKPAELAEADKALLTVVVCGHNRDKNIIVGPKAPTDRDWLVVSTNMLAMTKHPLTVRGIQKAVCEYFQVSMMDLLSQRREATLVFKRHVAIYLCRALTHLSLPAIGRHFGGRDHTTILNGARKIEARRKQDKSLDEMLRAICAALISPPAS